MSGGNGYDTVKGGSGTNIIAFDRTRDKAEKGGKSVVRQKLDASSSALILGSTWISPLTEAVAADTKAAGRSFNPEGMAAPSFGKAHKPAKGVSTTPAVIKAVAAAPSYAYPSVFDFITDESALSPSLFAATIFGISSQIVIKVTDEDEEDDADVFFLDDLTNSLYQAIGTDEDIAFYD